jgi:hypothetical protein
MLSVFPKTLSAGLIFPVVLLLIFTSSSLISNWLQMHEFSLIGCCAAFVTSFGLQLGVLRHFYILCLHHFILPKP